MSHFHTSCILECTLGPAWCKVSKVTHRQEFISNWDVLFIMENFSVDFDFFFLKYCLKIISLDSRVVWHLFNFLSSWPHPGFGPDSTQVPTFLGVRTCFVLFACLERKAWGFPGGPLLLNPPGNAGDSGSTPGPGRPHLLRSS